MTCKHDDEDCEQVVQIIPAPGLIVEFKSGADEWKEPLVGWGLRCDGMVVGLVLAELPREFLGSLPSDQFAIPLEYRAKDYDPKLEYGIRRAGND